MLLIFKLCYLIDIIIGFFWVIIFGECGIKCGIKVGCLIFIICDLVYFKICIIYKIFFKEMCG